MIEVRKAQIRDMPHVVRLDNQTQEFALCVEEAKKWFTTTGEVAYVARLGNREVGFALAASKKSRTLIDRVGVHPKFRQVGIGRKIIERITLEAATENIGKVNVIVPSYVIDDKEDPWNIEQWLWKVGFKATGVITGHFHRYNQDYDGYAFERMKP
jgi:N-acetylglutamate synthase-like GNAT family acetyltransferase